jgi:endonuclease III
VLLMPVDTHVLRLSQNLGLTTRRDASLATSRAITAALARVAPDDPVRFDFALTRLGILAECPTRERLEKCATCGLSPACQRRATLEATVAAAGGPQAV